MVIEICSSSRVGVWTARVMAPQTECLLSGVHNSRMLGWYSKPVYGFSSSLQPSDEAQPIRRRAQSRPERTAWDNWW